MGNWLMPGAESNLDGHFEDMPMVSLNDQLLTLQKTSWCFHDEVSLNNYLAIEPYIRYVKSRDRIHQNTVWGVKDPRLSLFLPEWHKATAGRSRYVIIIRHWKACIQSLLKRDIASTNPRFQNNLITTAHMWYSYNYRLLQFAKENTENCLVINQSNLGPDYPLPQIINNRFDLELNETGGSPFRESLATNRISDNSLFNFINEDETKQLDSLWEQLNFLDKGTTVDLSEKKIPTALLPQKNQKSSKPFEKTNFTYSHKLLVDEMNDKYIFKKEKWLEFARNAIGELEWELAEKALESIIIYSQPQPFVYIMLADCKYTLNKKNEAILLYQKAITLNPNNSNFFLKLGNLYLNEGQNVMAKETFKLGAEKNPEKAKWLNIALKNLQSSSKFI